MQYFSAIRIGLLFMVSFAVQGPVLAEADYPAAYFQPYIVYQAPEIAGKGPAENAGDASAESTAEAASEPDEKDPYPAAYFQPVIVYQDKDIKAEQAAQPKPAPAKKAESSVVKAKTSSATPARTPITDDGGFPVTVLILIGALFAGLYWVINKSKGEIDPTSSSAATAASGTGEGPASGDSGGEAPVEAS